MMKNIEIGSIRPPSESESLLVRVTRGCHWNKCYFCGLYKSMNFSMRPIEDTIQDIKEQAALYQGRKFKSCFLQDGDALVLKTDYLLRILEALNKYFPDLEYITSYARADSITRKSPAELQELRQAGLNHLYCGMETGSDKILQLINKGFHADTVVKSGCMAKDAGMILSEFILLAWDWWKGTFRGKCNPDSGCAEHDSAGFYSCPCNRNKARVQNLGVCSGRFFRITVGGRNSNRAKIILGKAVRNEQLLCE